MARSSRTVSDLEPDTPAAADSPPQWLRSFSLILLLGALVLAILALGHLASTSLVLRGGLSLPSAEVWQNYQSNPRLVTTLSVEQWAAIISTWLGIFGITAMLAQGSLPGLLISRAGLRWRRRLEVLCDITLGLFALLIMILGALITILSVGEQEILVINVPMWMILVPLPFCGGLVVITTIGRLFYLLYPHEDAEQALSNAGVPHGSQTFPTMPLFPLRHDAGAAPSAPSAPSSQPPAGRSRSATSASSSAAGGPSPAKGKK